jgi:hypothetical protein
MPTGPRIRANNIYGVVNDNPLATGSTTFNSVSLPLLPVVSAAHAIVVFDPKRVYGDPEIVVVTVHTAASTVATILRGQYGTSPRQHPQGTVWSHVPIDEDWIKIVTSTTRPLDPYRGQIVFETDTNSFSARSTADAWENMIQLGSWISWTPILTNLSGTTVARYTRIGRTIFYRIRVALTGANVGTNPQFSLPFAPNATTYAGQDSSVGQTLFEDAGVITYRGSARWTATGTNVYFIVYNASGTYLTETGLNATVPFTWGVNDALVAWGNYEMA